MSRPREFQRTLAPAIFFVLCLALGTWPLYAGSFSLLTTVADNPSGSPPPGIAASYVVTVNLSGLELNPASVTIDLPGGDSITADRLAFKTYEGFAPDGTPGTSTTLSDLAYSWRGQSADQDNVVLAVVEGALWALISGPQRHYSITMGASDQLLNSLDYTGLPRDVEDPIMGPDPWTVPYAPPEPFVPRPQQEGVIPEIDLLVLYTEQARLETGGDSMDPEDDAGLRGLVYAAVEEINQSFGNSQVNGTVNVIHFEKISYTPVGSPVTDVRNLKDHPDLVDIREEHGADVVTVILRNSSSGIVGNCGQAFTQRPGCSDVSGLPIPDCNPGPDFADWAVNYVAWNCLSLKVLAHEFGHNSGCEHNPEMTSIPPEDASFPWSYGHLFDASKIFPNTTVLTIMSLGIGFRDVYYSNADVIYFAFPTGVADERECAKAMDSLLPTMSDFRAKPMVFEDGFESGDTSLWSGIGS